MLDFFAGSASTAHAVLDQNREDNGNRRFILVQFPEPLPKPEAGLDTIADIGKERIRRVIAQVGPQVGELPLDFDEDLGFKVFKLAPSTFRQWERVEDDNALATQLDLFAGGTRDDAPLSHVQYELILKEGLDLNATITPVDALAHNHVAHISDGRSEFYLCLDDAIRDDTIAALPAVIEALRPDSPVPFICLDSALDDRQKVNLSLQCRLKTI